MVVFETDVGQTLDTEIEIEKTEKRSAYLSVYFTPYIFS